MYSLVIRKDFEAYHHLIGARGAENARHSHRYDLSLAVEGAALDPRGYLVDIVALDRSLEELLRRYRGRMLNDLPEFAGLNPSIEHFARILAHGFPAEALTGNLSTLTVTVAESAGAAASYRRQL